MVQDSAYAKSGCFRCAAASSVSVLRESSDKHPMAMFGAIVSAAFIWAFVPGNEVGMRTVRETAAPVRAIHEASTTSKTSRLPVRNDNSACEGQAWAGESLACLTMIARANGKTDLKIRLVTAGLAGDVNTPNVF